MQRGPELQGRYVVHSVHPGIACWHWWLYCKGQGNDVTSISFGRYTLWNSGPIKSGKTMAHWIRLEARFDLHSLRAPGAEGLMYKSCWWRGWTRNPCTSPIAALRESRQLCASGQSQRRRRVGGPFFAALTPVPNAYLVAPRGKHVFLSGSF